MINIPFVQIYELIAYISLAGLCLVGVLTLGASGYLWVRDTFVRQTVASLRPEIVAHAGSSEQDWEAWVNERSRLERRILRREVPRQLRVVSGSYATQLKTLGRALGIDERADRALSARIKQKRLIGLTQLTLLDQAVPLQHVRGTECPRERALAAQCLISDSADIQPESIVRLLLEPGTPLPEYGVYTLYRVMQQNPLSLLGVTDDTTWDLTLTVQVLSVLQYIDYSSSDAIRDWIGARLRDEQPAVRAAAVHALGPYIRAYAMTPPEVDPLTIVRDPSIRVRAAAFQQFPAIEETTVRRKIVDTAVEESNETVLLIAGQEFGTAISGTHKSITPALRRSMAWARATNRRRTTRWRTPWALEWEHQPLKTESTPELLSEPRPTGEHA